MQHWWVQRLHCQQLVAELNRAVRQQMLYWMSCLDYAVNWVILWCWRWGGGVGLPETDVWSETVKHKPINNCVEKKSKKLMDLQNLFNCQLIEGLKIFISCCPHKLSPTNKNSIKSFLVSFIHPLTIWLHTSKYINIDKINPFDHGFFLRQKWQLVTNKTR